MSDGADAHARRAISVTGDASGADAVSATGDAAGCGPPADVFSSLISLGCVAATGTGGASGTTAVSGTGHAEGFVAIGGGSASCQESRSVCLALSAGHAQAEANGVAVGLSDLLP